MGNSKVRQKERGKKELQSATRRAEMWDKVALFYNTHYFDNMIWDSFDPLTDSTGNCVGSERRKGDAVRFLVFCHCKIC